MSRSIAKNFMYNLLLQIVTLFMPLITVPYVSRILGKEGVGVYSYTLSVVQYFIILGTLGISMYGNRQIAYVRDNKEKMSNAFWSITFLKVVTTGIALLIYILIFGLDKEYGSIYLIQSINIIGAMIDISWLYMGLEDFKKTVIGNLIVKIIGVTLIFVVVKNYGDLHKYIIINALMVMIGNLVMWLYVPRTVLRIKLKFLNIVEHIIPIMHLFIPQIAIQIYAILDKTMLGFMINVGEVGLYEQSEKIIKLVLSLVTSLGVVMLPRMSNTFANGDNEKMKEYLNKSLQLVAYVSIPMSVGLAAVCREFVPWFLGLEFAESSNLMIILSPILFFIAISNVLGIQYLLPTNRMNQFTLSVTIGAIINVILNFMLIPKYKSIGTCIATLIAEFFVTLIQYIMVRDYIENKSFIINTIKYLFASLFMYIVVRIIGSHMGAKIITTIIQGGIGVVIYVGILILLKEEINLNLINFIILKIKNKKRYQK